jgi:hypothetical protein
MTERRHTGAFRRRKAAFAGTGPQVNVAGVPWKRLRERMDPRGGWRSHGDFPPVSCLPVRQARRGGARLALRPPLKAGTPVLHGVRPEPRPAGPSLGIARVRGTDRRGPRSQDGHRGTR